MTDIVNYSDGYFMKEALKEAEKAMMRDEIPVGAVIIYKNRVIGRAHNLTETLNDVTAHAEMQAYTAAAGTMGGKYLAECTLYVTLEPCIMCAGASYWAQIGRIVYGAADEERGFTRIRGKILHPKTQVLAGVLEQECSKMLRDFFRKKRK
jgi:tRNA(adenine34) deaminase